MVKLRTMSGAEVCALLSHHGFTEVRRRGSHAVMQMRGEGVTVTVPVPMHREVRTGTLRSIIRQSKLSKHLFETD